MRRAAAALAVCLLAGCTGGGQDQTLGSAPPQEAQAWCTLPMDIVGDPVGNAWGDYSVGTDPATEYLYQYITGRALPMFEPANDDGTCGPGHERTGPQ